VINTHLYAVAALRRAELADVQGADDEGPWTSQEISLNQKEKKITEYLDCETDYELRTKRESCHKILVDNFFLGSINWRADNGRFLKLSWVRKYLILFLLMY
jgi:hypothetical protein